MNEDNRGFTLVELVICMVIFAIVAAAAFGFMISGSRTYGSVTERLNLQLDSQLAMNQLGDYIIDCNTSICFDDNDKTLYVINKETDGSFTAHVFAYKSDHCIYYGVGTAKQIENGKFSCSSIANDLLAENVTDFSVALTDSASAKVTSAEVTIEFTKNSVIFRDKKIIALRNKPSAAEIS